jgi:poly(3-hydroxybutyrate) depolymerase
VLYPEQDRLSNMQGCWNWYDTRTGRAQAESNSINAAIEQVCLTQAVDRSRIALAGISAGAGMAVLLATHHPQHFRAIAMHSGIAPGVAHSSASAIKAMFGQSVTTSPLPPVPPEVRLPALLVIHGAMDHVVAPGNGREAAMRWASGSAQKPASRARCSAAPATRPPSPIIEKAAAWWQPCVKSTGSGMPGAVAQRDRPSATRKGRMRRG